MVLLLGGWPDGDEEATHDSITVCHMFAKMHWEAAETCRYVSVPWTTPHSCLHNSRIEMHDVTDRYARSWKEEPTLMQCQKSPSRSCLPNDMALGAFESHVP
jgi:hypothetical protein